MKILDEIFIELDKEDVINDLEWFVLILWSKVVSKPLLGEAKDL